MEQPITIYEIVKEKTLAHLKRSEPDFGEYQSFYLPVFGKRFGAEAAGQDLASQLDEQVLKHAEIGSCLIVGSSGMGKTSFTRQWVKHCWDKPPLMDKPLVALWIPLLSIENPEKNLLSKHLEKNLFLDKKELELFLNSSMHLVLCCDGYDELNTQANLYPEEVTKEKMQVQMIYTCRPEVIRRETNYRMFFSPPLKNKQQLLEYELEPFKTEQRAQFVERYIAHNKKRLPLAWNKPESYLDYLNRVPEIENLISNPFLLFMTLQALPQIVAENAEHQGKQIVLTRPQIYSAFMEQWWNWQLEKLEQRKQLPELIKALEEEESKRRQRREKQGKSVDLVKGERNSTWIKQQLTQFTQKLALGMFQRKLNEVEWQEQPKAEGHMFAFASTSSTARVGEGSWLKRYFADTPALKLIRSCLPLASLGARKVSFLHKSLLEFFAAEELFNSAVVNAWAETGKNLDAICLVHTNESETLNLLIDRVHESKAFEQSLWEIIELSKSESRIWRAAANAMTLLNMAGRNFVGKDLRGVHIGGEDKRTGERWGADLSGALLDSVDFSDADLRYVRLDHSWLKHAKLARSIMLGVEFGELPWLKGKLACYSQDGRWLALVEHEGEKFFDKRQIVIYQADSYQEVKRFNHQHKGWISCLSFSPDGQQLASGCWDNMIRLWDVESGKCERVLEGHKDQVRNISYRADGQQLASGSRDKTIRLWNVSSGKCERVLDTWSVESISYHPDGQQLASGGWDGTIRLWDVKSGKCERVLEGHTNGVISISYRADGLQLASGSRDKTIRLWDVKSGKCERVLEGHTNGVISISYRADGLQLASGSEDNTIRLWDAECGKCERVLEGHKGQVRSISYRADGQQFSSGSWDNTIRLWNVESGQCEWVLKGHTRCVNSISYRADGQQLASGSEDNTIRLWDAECGKCERVLEGHKGQVRSISYRADGQQFSSGSWDNTIRLWNVESGQCEWVLEGHTNWVSGISYRADGQQLASGSQDNTIRLWNVESGECEGVLEGHTNGVISISYRPDGQQLASGSGDNTIRLWNVESGKCERVLEGHMECVTNISYRPDGQQLASGSRYRAIRLWNVESGKCERVLEGHMECVTSISYRPDGQQLATGSDDSTIRLWDPRSGKCLFVIPYTSKTTVIAWQPVLNAAGNYCLSAGCVDGSVKTWEIAQTGTLFKARLIWSSHPITQLQSYAVDVQGVIGLQEQYYKLLQQRGGDTVKGKPSSAEPAKVAEVIEQRNLQKLIPSGEISVHTDAGDFKITKTQWLISMVRERANAAGSSSSSTSTSSDNGHVYLILQGLDERNYTIVKEFHLFLNTSASSVTFFNTVGKAALKIHDSSPWLLKSKQANLISRTWQISKTAAEGLIARIEKQQQSKAPSYAIGGKGGYNCLSWCLKQLEDANLPIESNPTWRSFICAVPSDYLPDAQADNAESDSKCCVM